MATGKKPFEKAMALAAISGLRMALGPTFLKANQRSSSAGLWALAAAGEMLLDKVGILPSRLRPAVMIPHALAGAWIAHESMKEDGVDDPTAPIIGAVVAAGVSCVAPMARVTLNRGLGISNPLLGLCEDYVALRLGSDATGVGLGDLAEITRDALEDVRSQVAPTLPSVPHLPAKVTAT